VSPAALQAVNDAIRRTGYILNQHARSLVTQRAGAVLFILPDPQERLLAEPNFSLLRGCTRALADNNVGLFAFGTSSDAEQKEMARLVAAGHVDGALLASAHAGNWVVDELVSTSMPFVACGAPLGFESSVAYVAADDRDGARRMVSYLKSLQRRRIATVTGSLNASDGYQRLEGYKDVVGSCELIVEGDYSQESGERAMESLLSRAPDLDAVFVASDVMALGVLAALRRAGRRVPEDVAVGGFGDSSAAMEARPALTTIRQPWQRISSEMVRLLLSLIGGKPPAAVILPTELVVREST
jgi:DNA-binding LacI/PurR family transcriptional regulator